MPRYDYRCKACSHEVEVMHGINDVGPTTCAICGGEMRKAMSTPAIHFKGSGWAKKDAQAATKNVAKPDTDTPATDGDKAGAGPAASDSDKSESASKSADVDAGAKASPVKADKGPAATKDASKAGGASTGKPTSKAAD